MTSTPTTVKLEFTEILTASELLPSSSSNEEFPSVTTESIFIDNPSPSLEHLVQRYDDIFNDHQMYLNFVNHKLAPWKNLLDFKYFDTLYQSHRSYRRSVSILRQQAQILLEEAEEFQRKDLNLQKEIDNHLQKITRNDLRRKLANPTKVYPRPPVSTFQETFPNRPRGTYVPRPNPRVIRCFQCNSPQHIKWYCPQYRCRGCDKLSPGHALRECPRNRPETFDDGLRGYFDLGGDEDGNLTGEC